MHKNIISWFYPGRQSVMSEVLFAKLTQWKADLVSTLIWDTEVPDPSNLFSMSLSIQ